MREDDRPNPDELLKALQPKAARGRGRLKIFFGACAGVGKTYAMLSAAQEKREDGIGILVGLVETHGRTETEALLQNLSVLPRLEIDHRGVKITEFDLDGALKAKPALILVDELAHTNAPGARHPKRWMDIEELRDAGIDVYATLNVQHVESLNDIVASITGISVKETVPDAVFDGADEVSLVDLPSDDLLERLHEGKVYTTDLGKRRAAENFFKRENLVALRELALRRVAERLDTQNAGTAASRRSAGERLAVCIGPGELTPKLLRVTKRLADGLRASWVALYVENARHYRLGQAAQLKLEQNLRLVAEMGAKAETIQGEDAALAIIDYARRKGITKLVIGKPVKSRWYELWYGSLANDLIRYSGEIDVYVVTGSEVVPSLSPQELVPSIRKWRGYLMAALMTAVMTAVGLPFRDTNNPENAVILYLLGIVILAGNYGLATSLTASFLAFLAYNFFFTQPYYSFDVYQSGDLVALGLLLATGFFASLQTSKLQAQSRFFRNKERNTSALYAMSQELAGTRGRDKLVKVVRQHMDQAMDGAAVVWFPDEHGGIEQDDEVMASNVRDEMAARWVLGQGKPAGQGTTTMPSASGYYLPLKGSAGTFGVLGFVPHDDRQLTPEEKDMLETFASLAASALERAQVAQLAETHKVEAESEKLRNALLSSVSHDLRTPLASIKGAISSLLMDDGRLNEKTQKELLTSAHDEVSRLERVVSNLLDVTRLESGQVKLKRDYYFVPELVGNAMKQVGSLLKAHKVHTKIEENLPALWVDGLLTEQILVNLLENAAKYIPPRSIVTISASKLSDEWIEIAVEDNGPGIPQSQEEHIFDKFTTFAQEQHTYGTGLGLTICRGIVKAHGGSIAATNRQEGGARFVFTLPAAKPPALDTEEKTYGDA